MNIYRHISNLQTLEREYSPSSCVSDVREFTDAYAVRSQIVRGRSPQHFSVQYGASTAESLDFFPAPSICSARKPRPVLAYIHGGYWQELSKGDHSFLAEAPNRHDLSYVAIGYGLAPTASLDEMVNRCRHAVAWVVKHCVDLAIDPTAIHVAGSSAGAHLAAMTALTDWPLLGLAASPISSLTLLSGIFDLRPLVLTYVNDAVRMNDETAMRNSPLLRIDTHQGRFPRTLVAFGDNETSEFKRQSIEFAELLMLKGYIAEIHEVGGRNHFNLPFDLADESTSLGALSLRHLAHTVDRI